MNIDSLAHLLRGLKLAGNDEVNGRDESMVRSKPAPDWESATIALVVQLASH
jgi:hypothetical protein